MNRVFTMKRKRRGGGHLKRKPSLVGSRAQKEEPKSYKNRSDKGKGGEKREKEEGDPNTYGERQKERTGTKLCLAEKGQKKKEREKSRHNRER